MTLRELQQWLLDQGVREELSLISRLTAVHEFRNIDPVDDLRVESNAIDWQRMLLAATILNRSSERSITEAALRIATGALALDSSPEVRDAASVLLSKQSNHRSIELAERRGLISADLLGRLGTSARIEAAQRRSNQTVLVSSTGEWLSTNAFQRDFWNSANDTDRWISVSAPTASGKTFLILRWVFDRMQVSDASVAVYIAPTRALVTEIESSFVRLAKDAGIEGIDVTSLPMSDKYSDALARRTKVIFVLTQERLHLLANLVDRGRLRIDLLLVDEAHKIGDAQRGVVLQDAIERVSRNNSTVQTIFLSPATQNPELLLEDAPQGLTTSDIRSEIPTVVQNLILASQVPGKTKLWNLSLRRNGELFELGTITLPDRPTTMKKKLAFISAELGDEGGTLVYANGAAEAEEVALLISQLVHNEDAVDDDELFALAELSRRGVHRSYLLGSLVQKGVAFHYGNMPSLLRLEIERLFKAGKIRFLVCTSTLIEGVNLSCRTIVVRGPRKGVGKPMEAHDFWNLAGRAGRWGDEFQGNIICIDPRDEKAWPHGVPRRSSYPITRETDNVLSDYAGISAYIENREDLRPRELFRSSQLEQVVAYLFTTHLREGEITSSELAKRHDHEELDRINNLIGKVVESISLPVELAERHPGVSISGLQSLYDNFHQREGDIDELLPAPPESEDAYPRLIAILTRINKHVFPAFYPENVVPLHALIILQWLKGRSLAAIIASRIRYHRERGQEVRLPTLIRGTMELVEQVARFRAPKYISAYVDVLKHHLQEIGQAELYADDLDIGVALEFGISTKTLFSLIQLGLSRMSATALYEKIAEDDLDQSGCLAWVSERVDDLEGMDFPLVILREIREKMLWDSMRVDQ